MGELQGLEFKWRAGKDVTDEQLRECSELYSSQYGVYGPEGPRPGERIRLSPQLMRQLLGGSGTCAALARLPGRLVGYAFLVRDALPSGDVISWVTQLVVHEEYRNRKVATRLFRAAWGLSDHFAWGFATANPYAVRALETATRRRCEPRVISRHVEALRRFGEGRISYLRDRSYHVDHQRSVVDTRFFVSHATLEEMMERSSGKEKPWMLGGLRPGEEWLAFTFREQAARELSRDEFESMLADHDSIVKEAYGRMTLDSAHKWAKNASQEVDFAINQLGLRPGASVLDAGCGVGRHSLELAKRGYRVVGVDFVPELIDRASRLAQEAGRGDRARFVEADCRRLDLGERFEGALLLYDVVGSFPSDADNRAILRSVANHLHPGGRVLLSVLNRGFVEAKAIHRGDIFENLGTLLKLPPSSIMATTGEIFDPDYYFFDPNTSLVYRKEQFTHDERLPSELIVRDRRYGGEELQEMCEAAGVRPLWVRHVRAGQWENDLDPRDAKEILLLGEKR